MANEVPTNQLVVKQYYKVVGTSGEVLHDGQTLQINDSFEAVTSTYIKNSGDAYVTEQFRFSGLSLGFQKQADELIYNEPRLKFKGLNLEYHPERYITHRRSHRSDD